MNTFASIMAQILYMAFLAVCTTFFYAQAQRQSLLPSTRWLIVVYYVFAALSFAALMRFALVVVSR